MKRIWKATNWAALLSGLLTVVLGVAILVTPEQSLIGYAVIVGIVIMVSGILDLVHTLKKPKAFRPGWLLLEHGVTILIGAWMLFGNGIELFWAILPFIFAGLTMVSGIVRIDRALMCKRQGEDKWKRLMGIGIAQAVVGCVLLFMPLVSVQLGTIALALLLVLYGISRIADAVNASQISKILGDLMRRINPLHTS